MENIQQNLDVFYPMMEGIANQFGDNCEVVLHDHSQGLESSIIAIINGHVTGRKVGDPSSNLGLEVLRGTDVNGDRHNYVTRTREGKTLRSTSIYIRNSNKQVIGALCINLDISDILQAEKTLSKLAGHSDSSAAKKEDVNEVFVFLIKKSGEKICEFLNISKYTLYAYLGEVRGENPTSDG